jgi:hypothetical protein
MVGWLGLEPRTNPESVRGCSESRRRVKEEWVGWDSNPEPTRAGLGTDERCLPSLLQGTPQELNPCGA